MEKHLNPLIHLNTTKRVNWTLFAFLQMNKRQNEKGNENTNQNLTKPLQKIQRGIMLSNTTWEGNSVTHTAQYLTVKGEREGGKRQL